uniref:Uncharacterized protein n=1 Tax=Kalanchoe fedtschenkoi TaxID=63787 RepID=A0A7N0VE17_KALFE
MGAGRDPDPNGPVYYKGVYHLFYQHNPDAATWRTQIAWGHSISHDLINWVHLDHALHPSESYDINGCWSGSITLLPGDVPAMFYTGVDSQGRQVQNLATPKNSSDPYLVEWVKSPHNPVMIPPSGVGESLYRDPTSAWRGPDGVWRVLVGAEKNGNGVAFMYKSSDFVNWSLTESPLHSSENTAMWECPDFYPVEENGEYGVETSVQGNGLKHVLKVSFDSQEAYILGKYVGETDEFVSESNMVGGGLDLRHDNGKFYASKSFYDPARKRRVLWGWVNESDSDEDSCRRGWAGLQSFPRSILLSKTGKQLVQWPIDEIEKLRSEAVSFHGEELHGGSLLEVSGITASQADVEVSFKIPNLEDVEALDPSWINPQVICSSRDASVQGRYGPFGLLVFASESLTEQTAVFFRIFRKNLDSLVVVMCSDQSRSSLRGGIDKTTFGAFLDIDLRHESISLRTLIDHSIVESFGGNGLACITARVYPTLAIDEAAHLYAFNNGTRAVEISRLEAWSMKKARLAPVTHSDEGLSSTASTAAAWLMT